MTIPMMIYGICSLGMLITSIYLTKHFFSAHFPEGISSGAAICNISGFWSCDSATFSPIASIFNIPIAFFGAILGGSFLIGCVIPSRKLELTNSFLAIVNGAGCLLLMTYSLVAFGGLCPICTIFYIFSWIALFLYWRYGIAIKEVSLMETAKVCALLALPLLIGGIALANNFSTQEKRQKEMSKTVVAEFFKLPQIGDPQVSMSLRLFSATEKFSDASLRISVFSDFECPFCSKVAKQFGSIASKYKGKMNMQFMAYPLDKSCNFNMERKMHEKACLATYVAACADGKRVTFAELHDHIFENAQILTHKWLNDLADEYGLSECVASQKIKDAVKEHITLAKDYHLSGTPTIVINGAKVDAGLSSGQWIALFDGIIKAAEKGTK